MLTQLINSLINLQRQILITIFEFFLNVFTELSEKYYVKRFFRTWNLLRNRPKCYHTTNKTQVNWLQFMFQWFIRFPDFSEFTEFPLDLRKTWFVYYSYLITGFHSSNNQFPKNDDLAEIHFCIAEIWCINLWIRIV